ncbi:hypothetical protein PGT21_026293 [Puccinia graminis f. sp. tritici]|uniref:Uncharacterized protein n=1 Tax=Puccinia graminis f. sp. tritici TaxID=56615 RepID=A0A5B0Q6F4_PUCGR|nr:hypothetical protein PGT21_026293 [Puccinia graminis f. sp. tritici]
MIHTGVYSGPMGRTAPTRNLICLSGKEPSRLLEYGIRYDLLHIILNRGESLAPAHPDPYQTQAQSSEAAAVFVTATIVTFHV